MITVSPHSTDLFSMHASTAGLTVFLDLFAIKELAKVCRCPLLLRARG